MWKAFFRLANLRLRVTSARSLRIPQNFEAFRCPDFPDSDADLFLDIAFENQRVPESAVKLSANSYQNGTEILDLYFWHNEEYIVKTRRTDQANICRLSVPPAFADQFCESGNWLSYLSMEKLLLPFYRLILHASAVIYQGQAYLFSAPSGGGKSTHANLWVQNLDALLLNGDKVVIEVTKDGCIAHGSPVAGSSEVYCSAGAPIAAIIMLEKASENVFTQITGHSALLHLYSEAVKSSWDVEFNRKVLDLAEQVQTHTAVYRLKCVPDFSAVDCVLRHLEGT